MAVGDGAKLKWMEHHRGWCSRGLVFPALNGVRREQGGDRGYQRIVPTI